MNMVNYDVAFQVVLKNEGELEENPKDPGGITKYGISLRFLRNIPQEKLKTYGIFDSPNENTIKDLTIDQVRRIYLEEFWKVAPFEKINNQQVVNYIFDMAIDMGISPAIKCAQRACWAIMKKKDNPIDDGVLGNATLDVINKCGIWIISAMRSERAGYYRLTAEHNTEDKEFLNGWLGRAYGT